MKIFSNLVSSEDIIKVDNLDFYGVINSEIKRLGNSADLNHIDVSGLINMNFLFYKSKFNGDISNWDVRNVKTMRDIFKNSPLEKNPPKWYKEWLKNKK